MKKIHVTRPKETTKTRAAKDGFYLRRVSGSTYQVHALGGDIYFEGGLFKSILFLRSLGY